MNDDRGSVRRRRYSGLLFDLDGTVVDTLELILSSYRYTMAQHLGQAPPDEEWRRTMGTPLREQLRGFARTPEELEAMLSTYLEHNQAHHDRMVRSFPGMRAALLAFRDAGYRMAIVTSKLRAQALRELRTCELADLFETLVCADDVERPKPHPEPVLRAARGLGIPGQRLLLVGDSIFDLRAGRAAGLDTAAALWGPFERAELTPARPTYWLSDVDALLKLLSPRPVEGDA